MIQSLISKLFLVVSLVLAGIGLTFLTLSISRSRLPYNSEGNYFDGVVNYHEQSIYVYGFLAVVSFFAAITLFAIRVLIQRARGEDMAVKSNR